MWEVGRLECGDLVVGECELLCGEGVFEVVDACRADDRGGDAGFAEEPCERELGGRDAAGRGDLGGAVDDGVVELGDVEGVCERVGA